MALPRLLLVSEFASDADWHARGLTEALGRPGAPFRLALLRGFLPSYRSGGLRLMRIINGLWVYAKLPASLLWRRPAAVLCVTTPPGIQLWCALLGRLLRIPVLCWMMDHHPEFEARRLARCRAGRPLAAVLRWLDGLALRRMRCVIALDAAMAEVCRSRAGQTPVFIFPPWPGAGLLGIEPAVAEESNPVVDSDNEAAAVRLLHVGSLGRAHDVETLERLLGAVGPCELTVAGCSPAAAEVFKGLAGRHDVRLMLHGRLPAAEFASLLAHGGADWGLVLLREELAGVVSPSKFTAYLAAAVPLLYLGPAGTSAHDVCVRQGAGVHVPPGCAGAALGEVARSLRNPATRAAARCSAARARDWLLAHDADAFVRLIQSQVARTP